MAESDETFLSGQRPASKISFEVGDVIGDKYQLLSVLARGGMGIVFRAKNISLDRIFALKILSQIGLSDANWKRFEFEAKTLARLQHPNIVQIYDMAIAPNGYPYYVMELLDGSSVAQTLEQHGGLSLPQFLHCFQDVCKALIFSHENGIIHRDIKPSNLMILDSNFQTKVVDFGIARLIDNDDFGQRLTLPGEIFGSPLYMSPEQTLGQGLSQATDIYSLGCTMFEAIVNRPPFLGKTALETLLLHQTEPVPEITSQNITQPHLTEIAELIYTCMAKKPEDRFSSVRVLLSALDQLNDLKKPSVKSNLPRLPVLPKTSQKLGGEDTQETINSQEHKDLKSTNRLSHKSKLAIIIILSVAGTIGVMQILGKAQISKAPGDTETTIIATNKHHQESALPNFESEATPDELWLKSDQPVSKFFSKNGKNWREFYFPETEQVGKISEDGRKMKSAVGHMVWPSNKAVHFYSAESLAKTPQIYQRFDEDAISYLAVKYTSLPPSILVLKKWRQLSGLSFFDCALTDEYIEALPQLKQLRELHLNHTKLSHSALIKGSILLKLTKLNLDRTDGVSELIKALTLSKRLQSLALKGVSLSPSDFSNIAKIESLTELDLRDSTCENGCLKALESNSALLKLDLRATKFQLNDLIELLGNKKIVQLRLTEGRLDSSTASLLKAKNPNLSLKEN